MSVDDFGIEVLKKSGVELTPGDKSEYCIRVCVESEITQDRVFVKKHLNHATLVGGAGTTIHSVTGGKTFFLTHYQISAVNSGFLVNGNWVLQDGADTVDRIPFTMALDAAGIPQGTITSSLNLVGNPIPFTTDVRAVLISGSILASVMIAGFEE